MEKLFKKACLKNSKIQINSEFKNTSLEQRIEYWSNTIPVGIAFNRLQEIIKFNYSALGSLHAEPVKIFFISICE